MGGYPLPWMLWLILLACSGEKGSPAASSKGERPEPAREQAVQQRAEPSSGEASKQAVTGQPVRRIEARATTEPVEGQEAQPLEVSLAVMPDDQVQGTLTLAGRPLSVHGIKEGETLRLWVSGGESDPTAVRRGYVVGTLEGDKLTGAFAISGNGGAPALKGRWVSEIRRPAKPTS
jgi:hypothetical protein